MMTLSICQSVLVSASYRQAADRDKTGTSGCQKVASNEKILENTGVFEGCSFPTERAGLCFSSPLKNLFRANLPIKIPGDFEGVFRWQGVFQQAAKVALLILPALLKFSPVIPPRSKRDR